MLFSSITFLTVFLPLTATLYYLPSVISSSFRNSPKYISYKNAILCIASLIFYAWGEPRNIILMILSIIFNYTVALHIDKCIAKKRKNLLLLFSLIFNIGLLVFFKYSGFIVNNFSAITSISVSYIEPSLPIGISFYTFQILSYVIDVYKSKVPVQRSLLDFTLYISMFPQLIAGPIVQYTVIDKQLRNRKESPEAAGEGIFIFIKGLAKKTILANTAGAVYEELISDGIAEITVLGAWTAIIFYAFQIYFDFSGYSDMAKGLGGIFGFTFPDNFDHPYTATSITDFWRRWHITLSSWFRDYVYIPLGGNRCSKFRNIFNLFVVWSLTGLWHGASWNFLLWGLYYFLLLILEKYVLIRHIEKLPVFLRKIITFILVLFGWVLFACTQLSDIMYFFKGMFGFNGISDDASVYILVSNAVILIIMAVCSTKLFSVKKKNNEGIFSYIFRFAVVFVLFGISLIFLIGDTYNPFLYFRF